MQRKTRKTRKTAVNSWHIAGLLFSPFAAWYVQYLVRWPRGPFGVLDWARHIVLGVDVAEDGESHVSCRTRLSGTFMLECSRCTLFWVGLVIIVAWWYAPVVVIAAGIMGAASLLDDWTVR